MPLCSACPRKQSLLNPGDLCRTCYEENQQVLPNVEEELESMDLTKNVNELKLGDIVNVIKLVIKPIV